VRTGRWAVRTIDDGCAEVRFEFRELQPGELWDLGTVRLERGGTLAVHDDAAAKVQYLVVRPDGAFVCGVYAPEPPARTEPLPPGDYVLLARSATSAAQVIPFAITAGRDTVLHVRPLPGVRRTVQFTPPPGVDVRSVGFDVRRDGELVAMANASAAVAGPLVTELCLLPGSYELVTRERTPAVRMAFEMREGLTEPVRVALQ
jgi:hypothetical protein